MKEVWKDVPEYEGLYQISNKGRVKSLIKNKIMVPSTCGSGYLKVVLCKNKKHKNIMIHRLVAYAFLPNTENKRTVNHIDGNKKNNNVSNLEWNTYSENLIHAYSTGLNSWNNKKGKPSKPVYKIDLKTGQVLEKYDSIGAASNSIGKKNGHYSIASCCKKRKYYNQAFGYKWRFVDD